MKRKNQRAVIYIVFVLLVSLVVQFYQPVPVMAETIYIENIFSVDIKGVTPPVAGKLPVIDENIKTKSEGIKIQTSEITWLEIIDPSTKKEMDPATDVFEAGKEYWIEIKIFKSPGYDFSESISALVNGRDATVFAVEGEKDFRIVRLKFAPLPKEGEQVKIIKKVDIYGVTPPDKNRSPSFEYISTATPGVYIFFYDSKWWKDLDSTPAVMDPDTDSFQVGKEYMIDLVISPESGYAFADGFKVSVTGKPATEIEKVEGENAWRVRLKFPPLPATEDPTKEINTVHIVGVIPPQVGKSPITSGISAYSNEPDGVSIDISYWYTKKDGKYHRALTSDEFFEEGTDYYFAVNIFTEPGYKFGWPIKATINGWEITDPPPEVFRITYGDPGRAFERYFPPLSDAEIKMTEEPQPIVDGSYESASFTSAADIEDFLYVLLNEEEVYPGPYSFTKSGDTNSTTVTLGPEYVKTLDPGTHVVKIVSKTGIATGNLVITEKRAEQSSETPKDPPKVDETPQEPPKVDETPKDPPKVDETPQEPPKVDETPKDPPKVDEAPQEPPKVDETPKDPPKVDEEAKPAADAEQTAKPAPRLPATGESLGTALWIALPLLAAGALLLIYRKKITSN